MLCMMIYVRFRNTHITANKRIIIYLTTEMERFPVIAVKLHHGVQMTYNNTFSYIQCTYNVCVFMMSCKIGLIVTIYPPPPPPPIILCFSLHCCK